MIIFDTILLAVFGFCISTCIIYLSLFGKKEGERNNNNNWMYFSANACIFTALAWLCGIIVILNSTYLFARAPMVQIMTIAFIGYPIAGWIANLVARKIDVVKGLYPVGWVWEDEKTRFGKCIKWGYLALIISLWVLWEVKKEYKNDNVLNDT